MLNLIMPALRTTWVLACLLAGTALGAALGWENHGVTGAIGLGFVGLTIGALLAASPRLVLQLLN